MSVKKTKVEKTEEKNEEIVYKSEKGMTTNPFVKNALFNIISYTNELDEKGNKNNRLAFDRRHYRGSIGLKNKLLAQIEVSYDINGEEWVKLSERENDKPVFRERFNSGELRLEPKEIEAAKFYFEVTDEIPSFGEKSDEMFTELLTVIDKKE